MTRRRGPITVMEPQHAEYQKGFSDGVKYAGYCNDQSDAIWHQKVVFDNLWASRPDYVAGYCDAFAKAGFNK